MTDKTTETPKLSHNETIKTNSRFLRGTLAEGLGVVESGAISEDDQQLIKFHGIYLQDDRDLRPERAKRKLDKAYSFMARLRVPGGVLSRDQYLAMDKLSDERGNQTLRITTRQSIQFHGVIKTNLRPALRQIDSVLLDTIAACGDVNRNVMCTPNEFAGRAYAQAEQTARDISTHLLPHSGAWREIFINDEKVTEALEAEPIYGATYLPRKFKIAVAVPPQNDVDVFAHDLSYIAIVENGDVVGYNVLIGGGMGATHGDAETFPRVGEVIGFCTTENAVAVAEAVVTTQRDYGNRIEPPPRAAEIHHRRSRPGFYRARNQCPLEGETGAGAGLQIRRQWRPHGLAYQRGRTAPSDPVRGKRARRECRRLEAEGGAEADRRDARCGVHSHAEPEHHHRQGR